MTTLVINIDDKSKVKPITDALHKMGVSSISVEEDIFDRIPGLAYTREERLEAIRKAEEDIAAGRVYTHEQVKAHLAAL